MPSKYQKAISEIKASDDLKERIKMSITQEQLKSPKKGGFIMKLKRILITISALFTTLVCGGVVYAALGGTINGVPVSEWFGIKFSQNYTEYEEEVKNQFIENDYGKIELQSTVCDDGFTIAKFNLKIKDLSKIRQGIYFNGWTDEEIEKHELENPLNFSLGFNTKLQDEKNNLYETDNNSIIIDGKQYYVNGSVQSIEENIPNNEYTVYQMWFLTDDNINNKENFNITLNSCSICVDGIPFKIDGNFNIPLSKSKAKQNTKEIQTNNDYITYRNMKKSLSEIKITPLQNIIKLTTTRTNADYNSLCYLLDKNYVGDLEYKVTDQNGKELRIYNVETSKEIIYSNGRREKINLGDSYNYEENLKNATVNSTEYLAIEKAESTTELNIEVNEINTYYSTIKNIGKYTINILEGKINAQNNDEIINSKKTETSKGNTNASNNITYTNSTIEWEEYPNNFNKALSKIIEDTDMNWPNKKAIKTLYSIVNNKLYKSTHVLYSIGLIETGGDMYDYQIQETNYNQYDYSSEDTTLEKYTNPIEFKLAKLSTSYTESSESNYLKDLSTRTKEQYELLKSQNYNKDLNYYYGLNKVLIMNGNNTNKQNYINNSRAKKIKITVNNTKEYIIDLKDTNKVQIFDLNYKQNSIAKPVDVKVEVLEAYSGQKTQDVYISDMQFVVTTNLSMGI